jgi:hypothetical protein
MELLAEPNTELMPENQTAEAFETLARAKQELAGALGNFQVQSDEIEANEKRLSEAQKEEQYLLGAEMDETEQVVKLTQIAALQRLLASKIEYARTRIEAIEVELRQRVDETHRSFGKALSALLKARQTKHLARLNEMLETEQRVWAEATALAFIQHFSDVRLLNGLGHQTATLLRSGAPRKVAESLLMDITKLEGERQKGR